MVLNEHIHVSHGPRVSRSALCGVTLKDAVNRAVPSHNDGRLCGCGKIIRFDTIGKFQTPSGYCCRLLFCLSIENQRNMKKNKKAEIADQVSETATTKEVGVTMKPNLPALQMAVDTSSLRKKVISVNSEDKIMAAFNEQPAERFVDAQELEDLSRLTQMTFEQVCDLIESDTDLEALEAGFVLNPTYRTFLKKDEAVRGHFFGFRETPGFTDEAGARTNERALAVCFVDQQKKVWVNAGVVLVNDIKGLVRAGILKVSDPIEIKFTGMKEEVKMYEVRMLKRPTPPKVSRASEATLVAQQMAKEA